MKKYKQGIAQASLEYLVVYGFGIIIVVMSLILTWQSGIFSQSQHTSGIKGFSQVKVEDFIAYENFLNLSIKNNAPDAIIVKKINASIEYKVSCITSGETLINSGEKTTPQLFCENLEENYPSGSYYKANILVEYINIRTNNLHHSLGTIWGIVE